MQHQHGVSDCGLFVTAVCITLVYKSTLMRWDRYIMRSHLYQCSVNFGSSPLNHFSYIGIEHLTCEQKETMLWTLLCLITPEDLSRHDLVCKPVIDIVPLPGPRGGGLENGNREETKAGGGEEERENSTGDKDSAGGKSFFFKKLDKEGLKIQRQEERGTIYVTGVNCNEWLHNP